MAHTAADGSKWTNASQARKVPGRAQGDGKQPVSKFSKPEPARQSTAGAADSTQDQGSAPTVDVTQDGSMFVVTARFPTAEEAHAAASQLSGADEQSAQMPASNPAQAMM